jgi:glyoxylase-like metal-dependent hydrolase (beta-lactamase superfamily II)
MAQISTFPGGGYECNSYLIVDEKVILIDSGTGTSLRLKEKVYEAAKKVDMVINTHAHLDHVGGNSLFSGKVAIHEEDKKELENGVLYGTSELFGKRASSNVDVTLRSGETIDVGELKLKVIHTPGHSPGSICLISNKGHLFSGDTLFSGGSFGRTDLQGGSTTKLLGSLERLKNLDFELLMPGHMECVKEGKKHLEAALELFGDLYERI